MSVIENLWSVMPLPCLVIGPDDRVTALNSAAESFLTTAESQLKGRSIDDLFGESGRISEVVRRARDRKVDATDHNIEFLWPRRAIEQIDLIASASEGRDDVLLVIQPRSIAEKIDRSLTHRNAARSIVGLGSMLAHEIKNPLAGISGAAQLLEMNASDDDRQLTELIREEAERIETLVNRVESFGDSGPLRREPVNIHDVLDRAKRSAEAGFGAHVRFQEDYDPSLPPVPGDQDQLIQVILNLLKNAAEATPEVGGVINLKTAYRGGVAMAGPRGSRVGVPLLLQISDNGVGVPQDLQRDMFEPFVTSKKSGSGLGLSLVSKIIADHGGSIECISRPGWTTFLIRLPIWRENTQPIAEAV